MSENPYWDAVSSYISFEDADLYGGPVLQCWNLHRSDKGFWALDGNHEGREGVLEPSEVYGRREPMVRRYAWAVADPDSVAFVAEWLMPAAVEMGAGTGYWAWQLTQEGVNILAFDETPPDQGHNRWHAPIDTHHIHYLAERTETYFAVQLGTPDILTQHGNRVLFLCWPPYAHSMATECLCAYPGNRLIYIGESAGGCNADDAFFDLLDQSWAQIDEHRPIQWEGIHDYITVYERKGA